MTGGGVSVFVRVRGITAIFLLEPFCVVVANLVLGEALDLIPVGTVVSLSAWAEEADRICNTRSDYIYHSFVFNKPCSAILYPFNCFFTVILCFQHLETHKLVSAAEQSPSD